MTLDKLTREYLKAREELMTLDKLTREYLKAREELILSHARAGRNMTQAAQELGVSRAALWILIDRNGIPWHEAANRERVD